MAQNKQENLCQSLKLLQRFSQIKNMDIRNEIIKPNGFYHIYNRGINSGKIFNDSKNYDFFLAKFSEYMLEVCNVYAYCLMPNHFHFLIKIKTDSELEVFAKTYLKAIENNCSGLHSIENVFSKQFGRFISSYTQAYNKINQRHGALLESPFKRKIIESEDYLRNLIIYIHRNPEDLEMDFKDYRYSSYKSIISSSETKLKREEVITRFSDLENFIYCHTKVSLSLCQSFEL